MVYRIRALQGRRVECINNIGDSYKVYGREEDNFLKFI